jgi:hypothetical protein
MQITLDQILWCISNKEVCAMKGVCVNNRVINGAEFPSGGQVDFEAGPTGHDLFSLHHGHPLPARVNKATAQDGYKEPNASSAGRFTYHG